MVCSLVNMAQSGFIPGRQIVDNDLIAFDLIKGYNWAHINPRCMVKVDMAKAYDSVKWCFLEHVLYKMGFPFQFVRWIMGCVTSVSYSILINGVPSKPL